MRRILGLKSMFRDAVDNVGQARRMDPTMEPITYYFALFLQNGHHASIK